MKKRLKNALSLVEVMISAVLFLTVVSGLFTSIVNCMFLNQSNANTITAALDAQYILEEIKSLTYSDITVTYLNTNYPSANFNNLDNESLSYTVNDIVGGSNVRKEVVVEVSWNERSRSREFKLSTRFVK